MHKNSPRQGQEHFVAPAVEAEGPSISQVDTSQPPESQWKQAWKSLRSNWIFWISATLLVIVLFVVIFPNVITSANPRVADLSNSLAKPRSEEHTSELQSRFDLVCRLLLEKNK